MPTTVDSFLRDVIEEEFPTDHDKHTATVYLKGSDETLHKLNIWEFTTDIIDEKKALIIQCPIRQVCHKESQCQIPRPSPGPLKRDG